MPGTLSTGLYATQNPFPLPATIVTPTADVRQSYLDFYEESEPNWTVGRAKKSWTNFEVGTWALSHRLSTYKKNPDPAMK